MKLFCYLKIFTLFMVGCALADAKYLSPSEALIVSTHENMGCLIEQKIHKQVHAELKSEDGNFATIREIKNPEHTSKRQELYLIFAAKSLNRLGGSFVVKLWCDNDVLQTKAFLSVDYAKLYRKSKKWTLALKVKGNAFIHGQMLYSHTPKMRQTWVSCPEADIYELYKLAFLQIYPLEGEFEGIPLQKLNGQWQSQELILNPFFLEQSVSVDRCQRFLEILDKKFAIDDPLIWEQKRIETETIQQIAGQIASESKEKILQFFLRMDDGTRVHIGSDTFTPHLRQRLAVKKANGKLMGALLWLAEEEQ